MATKRILIIGWILSWGWFAFMMIYGQFEASVPLYSLWIPFLFAIGMIIYPILLGSGLLKLPPAIASLPNPLLVVFLIFWGAGITGAIVFWGLFGFSPELEPARMTIRSMLILFLIQTLTLAMAGISSLIDKKTRRENDHVI